MMEKLLRMTGLLVAMHAGASVAQSPAETRTVGLDCWVGRDGGQIQTNYIRCIADRDLPHPELADQRLNAFLDDLHKELHDKSGTDAERMYKSNSTLVRESASVWNIRIISYPYEWSWEEERPQQLVRAVLCPRDVTCTVKVYPR